MSFPWNSKDLRTWHPAFLSSSYFWHYDDPCRYRNCIGLNSANLNAWSGSGIQLQGHTAGTCPGPQGSVRAVPFSCPSLLTKLQLHDFSFYSSKCPSLFWPQGLCISHHPAWKALDSNLLAAGICPAFILTDAFPNLEVTFMPPAPSTTHVLCSITTLFYCLHFWILFLFIIWLSHWNMSFMRAGFLLV